MKKAVPKMPWPFSYLLPHPKGTEETLEKYKRAGDREWRVVNLGPSQNRESNTGRKKT